MGGLPVRRIRCVVEYDGTAYVGWQTQPNGISVQETVEKALEKVTGERAALDAAKEEVQK